MKRIMILGASYSQIPLFQAAKKLGVQTIAASIPGPYSGFSYADEICHVNIADPEAVLFAAKQLNIDGIATCSLDLGMQAIGMVCEELQLPGPSRQAALRASNKWEMKKALTAAGVQTAAFFCIRSEEELERALAQLSFPVIVKAVDLMGSRGIYRCENAAEARQNYHKTMAATKKDYCLIEEFIVGEIFGVEAMVQNGQIVYMLPNNIEAFQGDTPSPIGHSVPYKYLDTLGTQIYEQVTKAIRALELNDCPVNCDMIRRGDKVYIIELTGRSGATGLSEMVSIYYDVDYYQEIIKVALGETVTSAFSDKANGTPNLTHTLMSDRTGILAAIHNENEAAPDILDLSFNVEPGDEIRAYQNGMDRIGQVIIKGESLGGCEQRLQEILSKIQLDLIPLSKEEV